MNCYQGLWTGCVDREDFKATFSWIWGQGCEGGWSGTKTEQERGEGRGEEGLLVFVC